MTPVTAAKVKYGVWGLIGGAIIAMIIGFVWGGCKHGQSILYTSAEIIDCIAPWNGRVMGLVERCARMLTTSCVYEAYFLITTLCRFLRLFRALLA